MISRDVDALIDTLPDPTLRDDSRALATLMAEATGDQGEVWSAKMVGFGRCHYRYPTGREGDASKVGFSPTSRGLTIYLLSGMAGYEDLLGRLGKFRTGKVCLYVRHLDDVDRDVLRQVVDRSVRHVDQTVRALGALPRMSDMPPYVEE